MTDARVWQIAREKGTAPDFATPRWPRRPIPSGRAINFTYDGAGRPYSAQEPSSGPSYLNAVSYTAAGAVANLQLGNLLVEQTCYNDLLQPVARRLGDATSTNCAVQTSTDLLHLGFGYGSASANNGNMMQQTIWAPDNGSGSPWTVTQDYTYDAVNRLASSAEKLGGATQWTREYSYDHFSNRWVSGYTGHTLHMATPTSQSAIQASTNRLTGTGITYDNAGNLTAHPFITPGSGSMAYDANNKMTAFTATGVSVATRYDAAGRRVRKDHNGKTTIWVYDAFGKLAAEYTMASHRDQATYFRTTDHLGSTRLTTDAMGEVVARRDYFPFGESIDSTLSGRGAVADGTLASFSASPGMRQQFTGQQRDQETGLDYFWARNYSPPCGRMLTVDQSDGSVNMADPQTWNRFSYVNNSPLVYIDPTGWSPQTAIVITGVSCGVGLFTGYLEYRFQYYEVDEGKRENIDWDQVTAIAVGSAAGTAIAASVPQLAAGAGVSGAGLFVISSAASFAGAMTEQAVAEALGAEPNESANFLGEGTFAVLASALPLPDLVAKACSRTGELTSVEAARLALAGFGAGIRDGAVEFLLDDILWASLRDLGRLTQRNTLEDWFNFGHMGFTYDDLTNSQYMEIQVTIFGLTTSFSIGPIDRSWGFSTVPYGSVDSTITYHEVIP